MNRRKFFKTIFGAGVIAATPAPVLAMLAPKSTADWLGMEPLPLGIARLSTPYSYYGRDMALTPQMVRDFIKRQERIYG